MRYTVHGETHIIKREAVLRGIASGYADARSRANPELSEWEHREYQDARRADAQRLEKVLAELDAGKDELSLSLYP